MRYIKKKGGASKKMSRKKSPKLRRTSVPSVSDIRYNEGRSPDR